jgi:Tat protein translocase TatB subunit
MFGIGMQELVLVFVIALVVVGPKQLPELARALGKGYAEFRRAFDDMKRSVEVDLNTEDFRRSLMDVPPRQPTKPESLLEEPADETPEEEDDPESHVPPPPPRDVAATPDEQEASTADLEVPRGPSQGEATRS